MIPTRIEDIDADLLHSIIGVAEESVTLDFKRDLPGDERDARKLFIADVCAFANTKGGDLVYGIDQDDDGVAGALVGHAFNPDDLITRLTNVLADGLEPRLQGVRMKDVLLADGGRVLVVRVPRAFAGIHRSARDGHFWVRDSKSNRQLDVAGITNRMREVLGREDLVASFFAARYAAILGETYPLKLDDGPKLVVHILPARDFLSGEEVDLSPLEEAGSTPISPASNSTHVVQTHEGLVHLSNYRNGSVRAATLLFRSGVTEAISTLGFHQFPNNGDRFLAFDDIENDLSRFLQAMFPVASQHLTGGWPITVRAAIVGAHGVRVLPGSRALRIDLDVDDRPRVTVHSAALSLPDLFLTAPPENLLRALRPMFDRLWQSWGLPRSYSYEDREGDVLVYAGKPI